MQALMQACDYAARRHVGQTRDGAAREPYVNHVIGVAARVGRSPAADETLVIGALLHDAIEDTDGTPEEIAALFGPAVAALVLEVTDDKTLPKAERKLRQERDVAAKSAHARRIELADKAANLAALCDSPPVDWDTARRSAHPDWALRVIAGCRGVDAVLEAAFDAEAVRLHHRMQAAG